MCQKPRKPLYFKHFTDFVPTCNSFHTLSWIDKELQYGLMSQSHRTTTTGRSLGCRVWRDRRKMKGRRQHYLWRRPRTLIQNPKRRRRGRVVRTRLCVAVQAALSIFSSAPVNTVSPSVVRDMELNTDKYLTLIKQLVPAFLRRPAMRFAGVPGSPIYKELLLGETVYMRYVLRKGPRTQTPGPGASPSHS